MSTNLLIVFILAWLLLAIAELTAHFFNDRHEEEYPAYRCPSNTEEEDADALPFGPAPDEDSPDNEQ